MAASHRLISTGSFTAEIMESALRHPNEKWLYTYLKQCEASTISGFYPLSLGRAAFETGIPMPHIIEILDKLEHTMVAGKQGRSPAAIRDDGLIFLPMVAQEVKVSRQVLSGHVERVVTGYAGNPENRAWLAFQKQFAAIISKAESHKPPRTPGGRFAGKEAPAGNVASGGTIAPPTVNSLIAAPLTPQRGAAGGLSSEEATYDEILRFFQSFRTPGRGLMCPRPVEQHADEFFVWVLENPRDDWRISATKWIQNVLNDAREEAEQHEASTVVTDSGVRFKL